MIDNAMIDQPLNFSTSSRGQGGRGQGRPGDIKGHRTQFQFTDETKLPTRQSGKTKKTPALKLAGTNNTGSNVSNATLSGVSSRPLPKSGFNDNHYFAVLSSTFIKKYKKTDKNNAFYVVLSGAP